MASADHNGAREGDFDSAELSPLERFFRLFTDMHPGEGRTGLLLFLNVLLILCAYYFVKPLREGWLAVSDIPGLSKMELKAYSSLGQTLFLVPVVLLYGRLVDRWKRSRLITGATLFCISNLVLFWVLQPNFFIEHLPAIGIVFYLWVGMFGVFIVAQFWAFAADVYTDERGRRLIPLVAIGATGGAVVGSQIAEWLVNSGLIGTEYLLLAATLPLGLSIVLTRTIDRREGPRKKVAPTGADAPSGGALKVLFASSLLLSVALITLLLNCVNTTGENVLFRVVQDVLERDVVSRGLSGDPDGVLAFVRDGTTAFYAGFYGWVNLAALGLQAFVASRLLRYGGFAAIFLLLPVIAITSYAAMALVPILAVIKVMKIAENATDYSISNTARHVLWLPMSEAVIYKGKTTIDTTFVRAGDGIAALLVLLGERVFFLTVGGYCAVNVGLVAVWIVLALFVVREHRRISQGGMSRAMA